MNAQQLYLEGGQALEIWFCQSCRRIPYEATQAAAEQCCRPRICSREGCTSEVRNGWTICAAHVESDAKARVEARVAKARPVEWSEWAGPVVPDGFDGFETTGECAEHFWHDGFEISQPIWGSRPVTFRLDAQVFLEHACEEMYEDAMSHISDKAIELLQQQLDEWAQAHGPPNGWQEDDSIVLVNVPAMPTEDDESSP